MPLTFIEIERKKSWRIALLFSALIFMYFMVAVVLLQIFLVLVPLPLENRFVLKGGNVRYLFAVLAIALVPAVIHFYFSAFRAVASVMGTLDASPPDREDGIHRRLLNVMEELHVATGNKRRIGCLVIPSLSMNALAAADLKGKAVIGITEGLLSRLTRPQLEAVLAHEAYHILSGDCVETTVAASLFGMYASALEKVRNMGDEDVRLYPAFLLFWILIRLSNMLSLFISREREYRADAASLRMTRNPVAMAEALHLLSRNWTGSGFISSGIEMLCIVGPETTALDESEGWWADLMSTHPPIRKRIEILLKMARVSVSEFRRKTETKEVTAVPSYSGASYYAMDNKLVWQGPYGLSELASLPWLSPLTWISTGTEGTVRRASEEAALEELFRIRLPRGEGELSSLLCPSCRQRLIAVPYEETKVYQCGFCGGVMVENDKIPRIIARRKRDCTDRVKSMAKAALSDNQRNLAMRTKKDTGRAVTPLFLCPECGNPMLRTFYSLAYLIEIDRCGLCKMTWFEIDELEMLQCLIENKITARMRL